MSISTERARRADRGVNLNPMSSNCLGITFDSGMAALIDDLSAAGILNETLIVAVGEFGRTTGKLTGALGRDHYLQQSVLFAGAGIHGGRALGATDAVGAEHDRLRLVAEPHREAGRCRGHHLLRDGNQLDHHRYDDPLGRGFQYVPKRPSPVVYEPINELWM